jgi:ubiquitin carboxyl-terminal hydrolase 34
MCQIARQEDIKKDQPVDDSSSSSSAEAEESYDYELIGVTVHTGNADGGHYYAFIRDRVSPGGKDKWFSFNDAEVKPFDPNQIATECFGGEMNSRTYDQVSCYIMTVCGQINLFVDEFHFFFLY